MTDEAPIPELLSSEPLATAGYIKMVRDTIRFPNGHEVHRTVVEHPGAVALVVLRSEEHTSELQSH